jgi:hypothetical protein
MKLKFVPSFSFTHGINPVDTRFGIMFGSQCDHIVTTLPGDSSRKPQLEPCLRFDVVVGLIWLNVRLGLVAH